METEEAEAVRGPLVKSPTETTEGEHTYAAAFTNPDFSMQTKDVADILALGTLNGLVLPDDLVSVQDEAFVNGSFDYVIVPGSCTAIGKKAFVNCEQLIYVKMPAAASIVEDDEDGTFAGCRDDLTIERVDLS